MGKFDTILYSNEMMIPNNLISEAINKLECGKSTRHDGVHAEAIKYAHPITHVLFSFCFSLFFTHGYMPANMIETTILPIIKNKCGNLADRLLPLLYQNYLSLLLYTSRSSYTHVIISSDLNLRTVLNYVFTQ